MEPCLQTDKYLNPRDLQNRRLSGFLSLFCFLKSVLEAVVVSFVDIFSLQILNDGIIVTASD